jgi:CRISPR-associated Cas5-like protein
MDLVLLRFDAPLMSFGAVVVDQHNRTDPLPYRAMLAGLVANEPRAPDGPERDAVPEEAFLTAQTPFRR